MKTSLRILLFTLIMIFISQNSIAQKWLERLKNKDSVNFFDIQKAFNDYWKDKIPSAVESENMEEGGYQQFKRWEYFMKNR